MDPRLSEPVFVQQWDTLIDDKPPLHLCRACKETAWRLDAILMQKTPTRSAETTRLLRNARALVGAGASCKLSDIVLIVGSLPDMLTAAGFVAAADAAEANLAKCALPAVALYP